MKPVAPQIRIARPPTGSDVARAAGVSKSAVSRAFNGGLVSEDARARIFEAARLLKYRPSLTARSLTTNRSGLIGVAITHLDNQFYPEVIEHISDRLREEKYRLVLFVTQGATDLEPMLDELLGYRLDGIVLASSSLAAQLATECRESNVPVIMFNNIDPQGRAPGVTTDNAAGAAQIARFLLAGDHRRFAIVTGIADSSTSMERCASFRETIAAAGLPEPVRVSGEYSFEGATRATLELLRGKDAPDAIFCVNDHMALAAVQAARTAGREPGRDISIVGFDNVAIAAWPAFALTTYAQPVRQMTDNMISRLLQAIDGKPLPDETVRLPGRLIVRATARRPAGVRTDEEGVDYWEG